MLKRHHRFMWDFSRSFLLSFKRPIFIYLVSLTLTLELTFASMFYGVEKGMNPGIHTYFDAFYYTITVMTGVGLGDIVPMTLLGKVVSIFMMLSETAIFVSFTGVLAFSLLQIESEHLLQRK